MNHDLMSIKQNEDIRKAFGIRLKELRKQKELTQKELAETIDVRLHN
jgi:DNA-binding XRE family transcriptional regulator